jgi:hypothetical protein
VNSQEAEGWIEIGLFAVGIYVVYKVVTGITNTVSDAASGAYTAAQNFDQNVGLEPFDTAVSNLFAPPAGS